MRPYRTVLEQKIRERRQTFEEFAEYVEQFAREHAEPGTLSVRHLQRLVAGRRADGSPLSQVHMVTARLLERIFGLSIEELLAPPSMPEPEDSSMAEIRQRIHAAGQVDDAIVTILRRQLSYIRHIDRQLGATVAHDEALTKASQIALLLSYTTAPDARQQLASLLSELYCLAGWQALDLGRTNQAWNYYDLANSAALETGSYAFRVLAEAGRALVLVDVGQATVAAELVTTTRKSADRFCSNMTRSWLAAAHGEILAANDLHSTSLKSFDQANALLTSGSSDIEDPYVALDPIHLARWRGHALAKCGHPDAVDVLTQSLHELDSTFVRAETGLHVDLALAFAAMNEPREAASHLNRADGLAAGIGSVRQQRRIRNINAAVGQRSLE